MDVGESSLMYVEKVIARMKSGLKKKREKREEKENKGIRRFPHWKASKFGR